MLQNNIRPQVKIINSSLNRTRQNISQNKHVAVNLKRVCAYCRVSTEQEDQQSSYELQVSYYTQYIQENPKWEFLGVYADEGVSGTSIKNRNEFQRMIRDCEDGKIDMVITKSISRFARNTLDCLNYVRKLKNLPKPVGIFFEKENIDTLDAKSELLLTILSSLAQDESRSTSENTKWAIQKKFQSGQAICPTIYFLGYDTGDDGNLVINEEEAKIIRRIFSEHLAGDGTKIIANNLMKDGIKTARGNKTWTSNTVRMILTNEKYCGDILMQKRVTIDYLTHKRVVNKGQQPQYFVSDHHPAIISKDDWFAVQNELKRRKEMVTTKKAKPQGYSNRTVFSNRLFCDKCGEPYFRRCFMTTAKGKKYSYEVWRCRTVEGRVKGKTCSSQTHSETAIKYAFMDMLQKMKLSTEKITKEYETALSDCRFNDEDSLRIEYLKAEIDIIEEKLIDASRLAMNSFAGDVYDDFTYELSEQLEGYQSELNKLNSNKSAEIQMQNNYKWFMEQLDTIPDYDPKKSTIPFREDIFKRLVVKGEVIDKGNEDSTHGTIIYTFNIGTKGISVGNHINLKTLHRLTVLGGDENIKI